MSKNLSKNPQKGIKPVKKTANSDRAINYSKDNDRLIEKRKSQKKSKSRVK